MKELHAVAARTALVLETNNLRGSDDMGKIVNSLKRTVLALSQQNLPPATLAQCIITHDGLPEEACIEISNLIGRNIDFLLIDKLTNYYEAKNKGFDCVKTNKCDFVVFADADCQPKNDWLIHLLIPFTSKDGNLPAAVAGRTSYAPSVFGIALTAIDFMYFPSPLHNSATRNFYANNIAFQYVAFAKYCYQPLDDAYRAHCQVAGLRMQADGAIINFSPSAHTVHRLPDTRRELLKLRWMRGKDSVALTPHLVRAYLPHTLQWLGRNNFFGPMCVMATRLGFSLRALNRQQLPQLGCIRYLVSLSIMIGISAIDTLGALSCSFYRFRRMPTRRNLEALSYHRD